MTEDEVFMVLVTHGLAPDMADRITSVMKYYPAESMIVRTPGRLSAPSTRFQITLKDDPRDDDIPLFNVEEL